MCDVLSWKDDGSWEAWLMEKSTEKLTEVEKALGMRTTKEAVFLFARKLNDMEEKKLLKTMEHICERIASETPAPRIQDGEGGY